MRKVFTFLLILALLVAVGGCRQADDELSVAARERVAFNANADCYVRNGYDIIMYSDSLSTQTLKLYGDTGAVDAEGPVNIAIPTAQATATPGLFVNSLAVSAPLEIQKSSTKVFQVNSAGNVYVLGTIGVTGASTFTGALAADGGITVDTSAFTVADTSGNVGTTGTLTVGGVAALNAGITVDTSAFTVADTSGNVGTTGTLTVGGAAQLNGGLTMDTTAFAVANTSGNTQIGGTLGVTGTTTLAGTLNADNGIAVDTDKFTVANSTGDTVVAGTFAANGGITVDTSNFTVSGTTGAVATASTFTVGTFAVMGEAAAIEVTEGSTITPTGTYQPITSTGVVSTSLVTAIANGTTAGQLLIIVNENGADAITLVNAANTVAKADVVLGSGDVAAFVWNGADWLCLFVRDNS